jgi:multidrug resistance protein, MATE family
MADRSRSSPVQPSSSALGEVWFIARPTMLTMASYTVMQFVDSLMVAQVGPIEVAAQGNGGIMAFAPLAFAMGGLSVVNTYVSQHYGAGRPERGASYAWGAAWLGIFVWLLVMIPLAIALPWFFGLDMLGHSPELQRMEAGYGQILLFGSVLFLVSRGLHHYFFGMQMPKVVTASAISGNIVNVIANYVFIFGSDGLPALGLPGVPGVPALGVYGAAIGTLCGIVVELLIPVAIFLGPKFNQLYHTRAVWRPTVKPMKDLVRIGWPAAVQFGNEITCWALLMTVLIGRFGEAHMAAGWITMRYMHLTFMPIMGISFAATSLVGKYIGAGMHDMAANRARTALGMSLGYMVVGGALFILYRHELVGLFVTAQDVDPALAEEIIRIGGMMMIAAGTFLLADAAGIVYSGALRGAGDTVWPGLVTIVYSWLIIVLGGWLMTVLFPQIESLGQWLALAAYLIIYGITMTLRFELGRWRTIRLFHDEHEPDRPSVPSPIPPAATPDASVRDFAEDLVSAQHSTKKVD